MGYFKGEQATTKIELTDKKYWVEIFTELRWGQSKQFFRATKDGEVDMVASADAYLLALIKDWNLDDEQGTKVEITEEAIQGLAQDDALLILTAAGINTEAADNAKKN